jgi:hypothetical protein
MTEELRGIAVGIHLRGGHAVHELIRLATDVQPTSSSSDRTAALTSRTGSSARRWSGWSAERHEAGPERRGHQEASALHDVEGMASGAMIGAAAGPPGMVAGAVIGAVAGGIAAVALDSDADKQAARTEEIGVTGGVDGRLRRDRGKVESSVMIFALSR